MTTPPGVGRVTAAAAAWSALFALMHLYWALGGRLGVPAGTEPISERSVFLAYDLLAGGLFLVGAVLLVALQRARRRSAPASPAVVLALRLGAAALLLRAALGLVGDVVLLVGGEARGTMLFDVWFLLGAVLFARAVDDRGDESAQQRTRRPLMRGGA